MTSLATTRQICGSCGSTDLALILDLGRSPISNEFPADPYETLPTYPLRMVQCTAPACQLVQIGEIVPDNLLWRGEYGYYSSTSPALVRHMEAYAGWLENCYPVAPGGLIVEVGCNDGLLLGALQMYDVRRIGVDPAKGPAAVAQAKGLDVRVESFGLEAANRLAAAHGEADLVIANNVAAHIADLDDFLHGLRVMLAPRGVLVMEVQYLPDLLVGNGFDMLYHEHRFFYSLSSLRRALELRDLRMIEVKFVETQGGSVRVVAQRADSTRHVDPHLELWLDDALFAEQYLSAGIFTGLQFRANRIGARLRAELHALRAEGRTIAGYGAPAKATTLLHWTRSVDYLAWMEDTTPAKIGRYMPGWGDRLPIREPQALGRPYRHASQMAYLLTAWNYAPYILANERQFIADGGRFVLPLPAPITL